VYSALFADPCPLTNGSGSISQRAWIRE